jgi:hypothetical protein
MSTKGEAVEGEEVEGEELKGDEGDENKWVEFSGPRNIVSNINGGVKIRICNELEASEHP